MFDVSIINILKHAFNIIITRCFAIIVWNFMYSWSFVVVTARQFWTGQFWWLFQYMRQIGMGIQSIFHGIEMKLVHTDAGISIVYDTCISDLQRVLRTCPILSSHWVVTKFRHFIKSGLYIAKHFVLMFIKSIINCKHRGSFNFEKKIPLVLNRGVPRTQKMCLGIHRQFSDRLSQ